MGESAGVVAIQMTVQGEELCPELGTSFLKEGLLFSFGCLFFEIGFLSVDPPASASGALGLRCVPPQSS